jgi:hypothetical protein
LRYTIGDEVTFKTNIGNHKGTVIDIQENIHFGHIYVIETNYGDIARLTEEEVD